MPNTIKIILARAVWDSRGRPTVEVEVHLTGGAWGRAIAPSGASRGVREALDLRDGGKRFQGLGVDQAVKGVQSLIAPALLGLDVRDQALIDAKIMALDPTPLKSTLGANATVATSLAVLHAAAAFAKQPLWQYIAATYNRTPSIPLPEIQIFGGGAHAGRRVDIQDFMIMVPGANSFKEALEVTAEVYHAAGELMAAKGQIAGVADEGGWWPQFRSNEEALETLLESIHRAGETPGKRVAISLDVAASQFEKDGRYRLALDNDDLSSEDMIALLGRWLDSYPIASIEDPLGEDDDAGMKAFTAAYGQRIQIVGDDYLVTNAKLIRKSLAANTCNTALIKVNQIGTVSEAIEAMDVAQGAGWHTIVSARSGESEDTSIVDLSIGLNSGQLKVGSFSRSERMAKWNACLRVEEAMGSGAFVGGQPLKQTWWGKANPEKQ
ncbi:MAG: phosphopyruvate hydratase [Asticcacaulis sp.]